MKKLLGFLLVVLVLAAVLLGILVRLAPEALVRTLENSLDKDVSIQAIQYRFPFGFSIEEFLLIERNAFKGENSLHAQRANLRLAPQDLIRGKIGVRDLSFDGLKITIRKRSGETSHPFDTLPAAVISAGKTSPDENVSRAQKALSRVMIHAINVKNAMVEHIDYDIDSRGFAFVLRDAHLLAEEIRFDRPYEPFRYSFDAVIEQGRATENARLDISGDLRLSNREWNAQARLEGLWVPYFAPYYRCFAFSSIEDGVMDVQATVNAKDKKQTANAKVLLRRLRLQSFEPDHQILGIDLASIMSVLQTNEGKLGLDLSFEWESGKPGSGFEEALQNSMRASLQNVIRADIDTTVSHTLDRIVEEGPEFLTKDWKSVR